jgi:type IV secretory pathway VirB2 component (pilin)
VRTLRKLVLGETWALPGGIAVAVLVAVGVRAAAGAGGWWREGGGFVLLGLLVAAFAAALVLRR